MSVERITVETPEGPQDIVVVGAVDDPRAIVRAHGHDPEAVAWTAHDPEAAIRSATSLEELKTALLEELGRRG